MQKQVRKAVSGPDDEIRGVEGRAEERWRAKQAECRPRCLSQQGLQEAGVLREAELAECGLNGSAVRSQLRALIARIFTCHIKQPVFNIWWLRISRQRARLIPNHLESIRTKSPPAALLLPRHDAQLPLDFTLLLRRLHAPRCHHLLLRRHASTAREGQAWQLS